MMDDSMIPILAIICSLVLAPGIIFGFILLMRKSKNDLEKMKLQREISEMEFKREELHLKSLQEENKKYDRVIEGKI